MRKSGTRPLSSQLLVAQLQLILSCTVVFLVAAIGFTPAIFRSHMRTFSSHSSVISGHVIKAFSSSLLIALLVSAVSSILMAGFIATLLSRRIAEPIESLAIFAESLSAREKPSALDLSHSAPEIARLAKALTEMSDKLADNQREQARMLRDLAHELRTPIATIWARVDGMEDGVVATDPHSWEVLREQLKRLNRLSTDVREVSHSYDQSMSTVKAISNPIEIGALTISAWTPRFESKGVKLLYDFQPISILVEIDALRIGQVLSNLLENALRHTPEDGVVTLSITDMDGFVSFLVKDSGEGISAHQLPHIFERLYRADNSRRSGGAGSGLGLTIARQIAENHGGTLMAESGGLGYGTTFTLRVPHEDISIS